MIPRKNSRHRSGSAFAAILVVLFVGSLFFSGCLDAEPEEMPPVMSSSPVTITITPAATGVTRQNASLAPPPVVITSPKQTRIYTDSGFPQEVKGAVSDFAAGTTSDAVNGYLRWESVRTKTNQPDKLRILEQIHRIDYAVFNTTIKENISVYIGLSGEQEKRLRNESVFSETGYVIASYDPSVVYHRLANSGRDNDGYVAMCVIDFRKGSHLLFVNSTEREFLLPHGGIWDIDYEDTYEKLEFSADSIPLYDDIVPTKVRLFHTREHP